MSRPGEGGGESCCGRNFEFVRPREGGGAEITGHDGRNGLKSPGQARHRGEFDGAKREGVLGFGPRKIRRKGGHIERAQVGDPDKCGEGHVERSDGAGGFIGRTG